MAHAPTPAHLARPTLTISVPPDRRAAFYEALLRLREAEDAPFMSLSALVVSTIIRAAEESASPREGDESHADAR